LARIPAAVLEKGCRNALLSTAYPQEQRAVAKGRENGVCARSNWLVRDFPQEERAVAAMSFRNLQKVDRGPEEALQTFVRVSRRIPKGSGIHIASDL
jgi:hypothetical protein